MISKASEASEAVYQSSDRFGDAYDIHTLPLSPRAPLPPRWPKPPLCPPGMIFYAGFCFVEPCGAGKVRVWIIEQAGAKYELITLCECPPTTIEIPTGLGSGDFRCGCPPDKPHQCPSALGSQCVDIYSDPFHCGGCNKPPCQEGLRCIQGKCKCDPGQILVEGKCIGHSPPCEKYESACNVAPQGQPAKLVCGCWGGPGNPCNPLTVCDCEPPNGTPVNNCRPAQ
jgi:hypothetical protein